MGLPKTAGPSRRITPSSKPKALLQSAAKRLRRAGKIGLGGFPVLFSICIVARIPPFLARFLYVLLWPDAADAPTAVNIAVAVVLTLYELAALFMGAFALFYAVACIGSGRRVTVYEAFAGAFGRLKAGLSAAAWWGGTVGLGLVCFLVPGLVFLTQYAFVGWIVVQEGLGGKAALARSKELTMRAPGRVAANLVLLGCLCAGVLVLVQGTLGLLLGFAYGLFDFPEDSIAVAVGFDLIRLAASQAAPVAGAVFLWALYEEIAGTPPRAAPDDPDDSDAPELISL